MSLDRIGFGAILEQMLHVLVNELLDLCLTLYLPASFARAHGSVFTVFFPCLSALTHRLYIGAERHLRAGPPLGHVIVHLHRKCKD